jgi:adenylate cyclase
VDDRGALTAAGLSCGSCGTELPPNAKFCNECGAPVARVSRSAEYKQVTVLFADVVHSMDIAAAVGAERLREIMARLVDKAIAVVGRYGGTVDKFTGDGIMAVFGALFVHAWPHWAFKMRPSGLLSKSTTATRWNCCCAWA